MRDIRLILDQLGIRLMLAITINFYIILFIAMFNDGIVQVLFNHFNEAKVEYVMYIGILPIIIYSIYYEIKETRKKKKELEQQEKKNIGG